MYIVNAKMNVLNLITKIILGISVLEYQVNAEYYTDRSALQTAVLTGYKTNLRPLNDQTQVLNLTISGVIYKMVSVDAVGGTMKVMVMFDSYWYDERITWTPSSYNGTTSLQLYKGDVWIPHLTLGNPTGMRVFDADFNHVTFSHTGLAHYHCGDVLEMMCQFDGQFWPFDSQECDMVVFAFDQTSNDVMFSNVSVDTSALLLNTEWTLDDVETATTQAFGRSNANFRFKLRRQSTIYIFNMLIPLLGLSTLNPMVFLLPSESGERVSYSTTVLLSITVFMSVAGDNIPKSSDPLPLIIILIVAGEVMALSTTFTVILNLAIYHRDGSKEVTPGYRKLVWLVNKMRCIKPSDLNRDNEENSESKEPNGPNLLKRNYKITPLDINNDVGPSGAQRKPRDDDLENRSLDGSGDENDDITWPEVSYAFDKVGFVMSLGMHATVCSGFLIYLLVASRG